MCLPITNFIINITFHLLCVSFYSKIKYNIKISLYLDTILRIACSNYISDLYEIVKHLANCKISLI